MSSCRVLGFTRKQSVSTDWEGGGGRINNREGGYRFAGSFSTSDSQRGSPLPSPWLCPELLVSEWPYLCIVH